MRGLNKRRLKEDYAKELSTEMAVKKASQFEADIAATFEDRQLVERRTNDYKLIQLSIALG